MAALLLAAGCSDWNDHYDGVVSAGSNATLWQQMEQRPELSDFREVLQHTKVFRSHKKTPVSYAELLDRGQSFTVMAPVNGTFNKDSLIALTATNQGDSVVEKFFVLNHLSRSTSSDVAAEKKITLLNTKHITMGKGKVGGVAISDANIHAKNGILHVMEGQLPYRYNLYEAMTDIDEFSQIGNFMRLYDEDYFDEFNSVSSGLVEGIPVYVDSVVIERNRLLERIGLLAAEDSAYWMVVPAAEGWNKAYAEAKSHFVYAKTVSKRDSIQQYWANRALLDDAIFNTTMQLSPRDSVTSEQYSKMRPEYHVFYKPFDSGGIFSTVQNTIECSNGLLYQTPEWPFTPEETYFRELKSEGEYTGLITYYDKCTYNSRTHAADSVSENAYLVIVPQTSTSNWEMTFRVDNTLSGLYDVCAVVLPKAVSGTVAPDLRPCKFKATINYIDTLGRSQSFPCGNTQFVSDPERVDTVVLAKAFAFPACNYATDDIKVTVKLTCSILPRETSKYAREMYLDCIYLRPAKKTD
jgi:hypothetical protein